MEVQLTPDQKAFARLAIEAGRLQGEEEAVEQALALWEERERTREENPGHGRLRRRLPWREVRAL